MYVDYGEGFEDEDPEPAYETRIRYCTLFRDPTGELFLGTEDKDLRELCVKTSRGSSPLRVPELHLALNRLAEHGWEPFMEGQGGEYRDGRPCWTLILRKHFRVELRGEGRRQ